MGCLLRAWHNYAAAVVLIALQHFIPCVRHDRGSQLQHRGHACSNSAATVHVHVHGHGWCGSMPLHTNAAASQRASPLGPRSRLEKSNLEYVILAGSLLSGTNLCNMKIVENRPFWALRGHTIRRAPRAGLAQPLALRSPRGFPDLTCFC